MSENAFTFCIGLINRSPGASQLAFSPARGRLGTGGTLVEEFSHGFKQKVVFFTRNIVHEIKNNFELSSSSDDSIPIDSHHNLSLLPCSQSLCFRFG